MKFSTASFDVSVVILYTMRKRRHEETRDSTVSKIVLLVGMSIRSRGK